jgi:hypothetical protein
MPEEIEAFLSAAKARLAECLVLSVESGVDFDDLILTVDETLTALAPIETLELAADAASRCDALMEGFVELRGRLSAAMG